MKYYFIINPVAGAVNALERYGEQIKSVCEKKGLDYQIFVTQYKGHATEIASQIASQATYNEQARIFAVGGDGTLCETANGLISKPYCELGCIPCGSGNDYIKAFKEAAEYLDFESYFVSQSVCVDAIKAGDKYSVNICSMGLDAKICDAANKIKEKNKKLSSSKAYDRAVLKCLFGKLYNKLTVEIDDREIYKGKFLFAIAASGQYYGGGYHSAPLAVPSDGLLDFILIKTVSHLKAAFIIGDYKSGEYVHKRSFKKLLIYSRGKKMRIKSKKPAILNIDGECEQINDITLEVVPSALRFVVPASYEKEKQEAFA